MRIKYLICIGLKESIDQGIIKEQNLTTGDAIESINQWIIKDDFNSTRVESTNSSSSFTNDELEVNLRKNENLVSQLHDVREKYHAAYQRQRCPLIYTRSENISSNYRNDSQSGNDVLIVSDSIMDQIDEKRLRKHACVKVCCYGGSTINEMKHHITPLLSHNPSHILLHVSNNDAPFKIVFLGNSSNKEEHIGKKGSHLNRRGALTS